jgi:hypothetical protein
VAAYVLLFIDQETLGHGRTRESLTCSNAGWMPSCGKSFCKQDCISDGTFHLVLGDVCTRLVCNAASFSGEPQLDLGFHARAYPFRNCAFSLVESRYSETCWPCDSFWTGEVVDEFCRERRFCWCVVPTAREKRIAPLRKRGGSELLSLLLSNDRIDHQPTDILPLVASRWVQICEIYERGGDISGTSIIGTSACGFQRISCPTDE